MTQLRLFFKELSVHVLSDLRQMQEVTILGEKRETLKRETMTGSLTGNETDRA